MNKQKRSPLKNSPLRTPGQSLDDEIQRIMGDEVVTYLLFPIMLMGFTIWNWLLWYQIVQISNPISLTVIVIIISIYCFFKILKVRTQIRALRLGRDGEKAVGQTLDSLKRKGYRVFHDVIGGEFNLDHVIVNEHGVFSIETKTYSKPKKGECKITYSEAGLSINGYKPNKKIIIQVKAQKNWLEKQVVNLTGIKLTVKPVIVFPGWYIENQNKQSDIWVLEPKALPSYIANTPKVLTELKFPKILSSHHAK